MRYAVIAAVALLGSVMALPTQHSTRDQNTGEDPAAIVAADAVFAVAEAVAEQHHGPETTTTASPSQSSAFNAVLEEVLAAPIGGIISGGKSKSAPPPSATPSTTASPKDPAALKEALQAVVLEVGPVGAAFVDAKPAPSATASS